VIKLYIDFYHHTITFYNGSHCRATAFRVISQKLRVQLPLVTFSFLVFFLFLLIVPLFYYICKAFSKSFIINSVNGNFNLKLNIAYFQVCNCIITFWHQYVNVNVQFRNFFCFGTCSFMYVCVSWDKKRRAKGDYQIIYILTLTPFTHVV